MVFTEKILTWLLLSRRYLTTRYVEVFEVARVLLFCPNTLLFKCRTLCHFSCPWKLSFQHTNNRSSNLQKKIADCYSKQILWQATWYCICLKTFSKVAGFYSFPSKNFLEWQIFISLVGVFSLSWNCPGRADFVSAQLSDACTTHTSDGTAVR